MTPRPRHLASLLLAALASLATTPGLAHDFGITDTSVLVGHTLAKLTFTTPQDQFDAFAHTTEARTRKTTEILQVDNISPQGLPQPCSPTRHSLRDLDHIQARQLTLLYDCAAPIHTLRLSWRPSLPEADKNLIRITLAGRHQSSTLSRQQATLDVPVSMALQQWNLQLRDEPLLFQGQPMPNNQQLDADALHAALPYLPLGIEHVLLGLDHVLFLLAMLLLPAKPRQLLILVTTFTLAHSLTLAMAVFDLLTLPPRLVEPLIALSILALGLENAYTLRQPAQRLANAHTRRLPLTFTFGLLHGLGFSFVLQDIGLGSQKTASLLAFNLGVEAGQLLIVGIFLPSSPSPSAPPTKKHSSAPHSPSSSPPLASSGSSNAPSPAFKCPSTQAHSSRHTC